MRSFRILLVEDSDSDVRLVREAIREAGKAVELTIARDGMEAMAILKQVEEGTRPAPELVLLDLNMPRKNGHEVLAEVKGSPSLRQLPVLVMTSSQADEDVAKCYDLNANCYITKPNNLADYIHVIHAIEDFWFSTATLPDLPIIHKAKGSGGLALPTF